MRFPFVIDQPLYCYLLLDTFITQKNCTPMSHRYGSTAFLMNTCIGPIQLQLKKL